MTSPKRILLTVESNEDKDNNSKNIGEVKTLRDAIIWTQKKVNLYDIVFTNKNDAKPRNNLDTPFFTIELKKPLPNIIQSDIQINKTSPSTVILIPVKSSSGQQAKAFPLNGGGENKYLPSGSILTIGDPEHAYGIGASTRPTLLINNVDKQ